jgi:hypothetical protein
MLDLPRAISLYEQAWDGGVAIARFELDRLYEHGVNRSVSNTDASAYINIETLIVRLRKGCKSANTRWKH